MEESNKRRKLSLKAKKKADDGDPVQMTSASQSTCSVTSTEEIGDQTIIAARLELRKQLAELRWAQRPLDCEWSALPDLPDTTPDDPSPNKDEIAQKDGLQLAMVDQPVAESDVVACSVSTVDRANESVDMFPDSFSSAPMEISPPAAAAVTSTNAMSLPVASTTAVSRPPKITNCPLCLVDFPFDMTQVDMDFHIASCLQALNVDMW